MLTVGTTGRQFPTTLLDHYSHDDIIHAMGAGWFVGYPDGSFRPDQAMTADQMTTVFGRAFPKG